MSNNRPRGPLSILGDPIVGNTLIARPNSIVDKDGIQRDTGEFQWLRDGDQIPYETHQTYIIREEDQGKDIAVLFTYTDGRGNPEQVISKHKSVPAAIEPRFIEYLYRKHLHRDPDPDGAAFWLKVFEDIFVRHLPKR